MQQRRCLTEQAHQGQSESQTQSKNSQSKATDLQVETEKQSTEEHGGVAAANSAIHSVHQ